MAQRGLAFGMLQIIAHLLHTIPPHDIRLVLPAFNSHQPECLYFAFRFAPFPHLSHQVTCAFSASQSPPRTPHPANHLVQL